MYLLARPTPTNLLQRLALFRAGRGRTSKLYVANALHWLRAFIEVNDYLKENGNPLSVRLSI